MATINDELHVFIGDYEVENSRLTLEQILTHYGIDVTKPYQGRHDPYADGHVYTQKWEDTLRAQPPP